VVAAEAWPSARCTAFTEHRVTLYAVRLSNSATTYNLKWNGGYMADSRCLERTVQGKIAKRYTKQGGYDELCSSPGTRLFTCVTAPNRVRGRLLT
jgi:hypothetical protein